MPEQPHEPDALRPNDLEPTTDSPSEMPTTSRKGLDHEQFVASHATDMVGKKIGNYTIKSIIGSGGMGTVFQAQQEQPSRRVAIKMMKRGITSRNALRRFEFETQVLGRLQHPVIAQIYEAGTFDDGGGTRPYFAMEYISSAKELVDYIESKQLDVRERLELIRKFCEGVEYGHQRGVIHRDLKPGNILVGINGQPKIIDFGVARSTDSDAVSATLSTESGQLIGTLQYMSPEQVELDPADLDTRSDVYSIGVILHEVLTGAFPYELTGASLTKAAKLIKESRPRRLGEINAKFEGDLETIALKALEKDRDDRYQSVGDLSEDIRRYLADEAIMARKPRRTEQFRRFVRKHRLATATTIIVSLALLALTGLSAILYQDAKKNLVQSRKNLEIALTFNELLTEGLGSLSASDGGKRLRDTILNEANGTFARTLPPDERDSQMALLEKALEPVNFTDVTNTYLADSMILPMIGGIDALFTDDPYWHGAMLVKMGKALRGLGQEEVAETQLRRSIELLEAAVQPEQKDLLIARGMLATLLYGKGELAEAEDMYRSVLPGYLEAWGTENIRTLEIQDAIGGCLIGQGRYEEGSAVIGEGLETRRRLFGDDDYRTLNVMDNYAASLTWLERFDEAEQYAREAWLGWRRNNGDHSMAAMRSQSFLAAILVNQERFREAEELMQQALPILREYHGNDHSYTLEAMSHLSAAMVGLEQHEEAEALLQERLKLCISGWGVDHVKTFETRNQLGDFYIKMERFEDALPLAKANERTLHDSSWANRRQALEQLVELHEAWHKAEPNAEHDAKAAEYRAQVEAIEGRKPDQADSAIPAVP
ncbi:MAG: serine/threonine-protein kinase [Planctomycetota bacterium]|nr:serine/threonine-protein kinase [Planctomycetota bacterium]